MLSGPRFATGMCRAPIISNRNAAGTKQVLPLSAGKPDIRAEAGISQKRGGTIGKRAEKYKASQRAADRAHNEAILAKIKGTSVVVVHRKVAKRKFWLGQRVDVFLGPGA